MLPSRSTNSQMGMQQFLISMRNNVGQLFFLSEWWTLNESKASSKKKINKASSQ